MTAATLPRTAEPTAESLLLARLDADIAAIDAKLKDAHGWEDHLIANRDRLIAQRERLHLVATTALGA